MRIQLNMYARKLVQTMTDDAGHFLHHSLDADEHTEDEVKTLINAFPSALSFMSVDDDYETDEGEDEDEDDEPSETSTLHCQFKQRCWK